MYFITSHTSSRFVVKWKLPSSSEYVPIPTEAFAGEECINATENCGVVGVAQIPVESHAAPVRVRLADGLLKVEGMTGVAKTVEVYDAAGRQALTHTLGAYENAFPATGTPLSSGVHFVRVTGANGKTIVAPALDR